MPNTDCCEMIKAIKMFAKCHRRRHTQWLRQAVIVM